ncbi:hypothetical protein [Bacillus sp. CHD6a]|uniref:hypothetical protein n=1 Tax=Bacillus sp. CHD6a TaxID=1643452 RepID=UPI0006CD5907|nr:hypothetical protein [Bacillus sp. CHD6a]KPB06271.1 hypothetical protein AAV98_00225 [Bacillus sp. CHD6a]
MKVIEYSQVWNLDNLFPDGSTSIQFREHIKFLESKVCDLEKELSHFNTPKGINESLTVAELIDSIGHIRMNLSQSNSYVTCLLAQNTKDQNVPLIRDKTASINARFETALKKLQSILLKTEYEIMGIKQ